MERVTRLVYISLREINVSLRRAVASNSPLDCYIEIFEPIGSIRKIGAGDEARTRYLHLGKVALYRMSYTRILVPKGNHGASGRNRTNDTRIFSPLLYLLSYRGILSRA